LRAFFDGSPMTFAECGWDAIPESTSTDVRKDEEHAKREVLRGQNRNGVLEPWGLNVERV